MYTILHLENSEFFRKIFGNIFGEKGINYIATKTVEESLEILEKEKIDLILTAVEIPKGNIKEFLEKINSNIKYADIPVFVLTGDDELDRRKEVFQFGIVDYLLKKTSIDDIVKVIENFINEDKMVLKLKKLKIAVLDDSKLETNVVKTIFKDKKIWNVDYYENGRELMNIDKDYDIYLIDMVLKDCSGEEVILKIREKNNNSVIIAVSAITNEKTISHMLSIGADDYIVKPYVTEVFMARIKSRIRSYLIIKELSNKLEKKEENCKC